MMSMTVAFAGNREKSTGKMQKAPEVNAFTMQQNYDMTVDYRSLAVALGLNNYQMKAVAIVHDTYIAEMNAALEAQADDRKELVKQATDKELQFMSYVLNASQLDKFTQLLNLTLSNRGLLD